jgi:predicted RNase H-related nuclease YkuK (DUF458 family)
VQKTITGILNGSLLHLPIELERKLNRVKEKIKTSAMGYIKKSGIYPKIKPKIYKDIAEKEKQFIMAFKGNP